MSKEEEQLEEGYVIAHGRLVVKSKASQCTFCNEWVMTKEWVYKTKKDEKGRTYFHDWCCPFCDKFNFGGSGHETQLGILDVLKYIDQEIKSVRDEQRSRTTERIT